MDLYWLPELRDWADAFKAVNADESRDVWPSLVQLAGSRLDVVRTERLARAMARFYPTTPPSGLAAPPIRLALLGSSTVEHLVSGIRVAGLRRNLWVDVYTGASRPVPSGARRSQLRPARVQADHRAVRARCAAHDRAGLQRLRCGLRRRGAEPDPRPARAELVASARTRSRSVAAEAYCRSRPACSAATSTAWPGRSGA